MSTLNLLYKKQYDINDDIHVVIPTVGDILQCEDNYYNLVTIFTAMPIDLMVQLYDAGIDFTTINQYDLFVLLAQGLRSVDTTLLFGDLDFSNFQLEQNQQNHMIVFRDPNTGIMIDRGIFDKISATLCKIHHIKKDRRKPANEAAKKYMIQRARAKQARYKRHKQDSDLQQLIIAMVNTEQFKYDFQEVKNLTIYQFNESVRQVVHKIDYDNVMRGIYFGTVDSSKLDRKIVNWMIHE